MFRESFIAHLLRGIRKIISSFYISGYFVTLKMILHNFCSATLFYRMEKQLSRPEYKLYSKIPIDIEILDSDVKLTTSQTQRVIELRGQYGLEQFKGRLNKGDIPVLPIHDSFIIDANHYIDLKVTMQEAVKFVFGDTIPLKVDNIGLRFEILNKQYNEEILNGHYPCASAIPLMKKQSTN